MNLLALSASGPVPSAALVRDGVVLGLKRDDGGRTHSETLLPLTDALLCECGLSFKDMDIFAADVGPGSFTGVRIGVCALNAMAAACGDKPVVPVSSLEALAHLAGISEQRTVCALLDARNGNGYAALYGSTNLAPCAVEVESFVRSLPEGTLFVGDWQVHYETICNHVKNPRFSSQNTLLADSVAQVAWAHYQQGRFLNEALPLYLRPSQAERLRQGRA